MPKVSQLPSDNSPTTDDLMLTVDSTNGETRKVTLAELAALLSANIANDSVGKDQIDFDDGVFWEEIGRDTLTEAGDTLEVTSLPLRKYLKVIIFTEATGGTQTQLMTFNGDSGSNYAVRRVLNDTQSSSTSSSSVSPGFSATTVDLFSTIEILNIATIEKLVNGQHSDTEANGAGTAPSQSNQVSKWANTADQIDQITVANGGSGDFAIGSEMVVLGHN